MQSFLSTSEKYTMAVEVIHQGHRGRVSPLSNIQFDLLPERLQGGCSSDSSAGFVVQLHVLIRPHVIYQESHLNSLTE